MKQSRGELLQLFFNVLLIGQTNLKKSKKML